MLLAKVTAASYHEPSANDTRRRIVAFFRTHLRTE
jgi:carboxymethylenebutenolidase